MKMNNEMIEKKVYSWLGLCTRAGNLVSGDDTTLRSLKKGAVKLVIIAEDASNNTKKLFSDKCSFRNIVFFEFGNKVMLGNSIGKSPRAVVGILDKNISIQLINLLEDKSKIEK